MIDPVALPVAAAPNAPGAECMDAPAEAFGIALEEAVREGQASIPETGAEPPPVIAALVAQPVAAPRTEPPSFASRSGPSAEAAAPAAPTEATIQAEDLATPSSVEPPDVELPPVVRPADAVAPRTIPAPPPSAAAPAPPPHAQIAQAVETLVHDPRPDTPPPLLIRLEPADLGQVEVRIAPARGGAVRVEIVAERPETMALLQRDQHDLVRALDRAGFIAGEPPVFALVDQRGGGASGRRPGEGRPQASATRARAPSASISSAPARPMHRPAGRLDLIA